MKNLNAIFKKFKGVDGALITSEPGTFYLSGYINDAAFILLTKDSALYFTDSRYTEEATAACGDLAEVVTVKSSNVFSTIEEYVRKFNIKTLGFEGKYVSFNTYSAMANAFDGVKLVPVDNALDEARMVKTREELSLIKKAAAINDKAFTRMLKKVKAGVTEKQLSSELEYQMRKLGADGATHIYCASSGFRRVDGKITKHLGLNECAMYFDDMYTEVIADDVHIGENLFKFIYKCKGYEKIILVSDALAPCGAPVGEYILGENTPVIADGTAAYLKDKSALAGSTTNIAKMVEIIVRYGVPLEKAVYCATESPRKYLGLEIPALSVGYDASFNVVDERGKVTEVYSKGKKVL